MPGRFKLDENLPRDAKALLLAAAMMLRMLSTKTSLAIQTPKYWMRVAPKVEYSLR
jgi:hypothetical protein